MRRTGRHGAFDAGDDYNPVTDLVFTLFAVAILLLAVVGSTGAVREQSQAEQLAEKDRIISALRRRLGQAPLPAAALPAAPLPKAPEPARPEEVAEVPDRSADVATLEEALRLATVDVERLRRAAGRRVELARLTPDRASGFLIGQSLDEEIALDLLLSLGGNLDAITAIEANRITFEVDVAPRLAARGANAGEGADDAEYEQSVAVARALMRRLRATPIPFTCFSATPFGKNRASSLAPLGQTERPGGAIEDFENLPDGPGTLTKSRAALDAAAAFDNRIVVIAEHVVTAPCEADRLATGIRRWASAP